MKELFNNFGKLFGANLVAQIILTASLPVIGYLYKPELFGELGVLIAIASLLTIIATLKLDTYVLTFPGKSSDLSSNTAAVLKLSFFFALPVVVITYICLELTSLNDKYQITVLKYLCILILVLALSFNNILTSGLIRLENIRAVAQNALIRAIVLVTFQAIFGFWGILYGLIASELISRVVSNIFLFTKFKCHSSEYNISKVSLLGILNKAKRYPIYIMPSSLISSMNVQIPILFAASILDIRAAGLFFMANRIISIPAAMISTSLSKVLVPFIIKKPNPEVPEFIKKFVMLAFIILSVLSLITVALLNMIDKYIPNDWAGVSEIIVLYLALLPFMVSVSSVSQIFNINNRQEMLLKVDALRLTLILSALWYPLMIGEGLILYDYTLYVVLASVVGYIVQFVFILKAMAVNHS